MILRFKDKEYKLSIEEEQTNLINWDKIEKELI